MGNLWFKLDNIQEVVLNFKSQQIFKLNIYVFIVSFTRS
jgi:hypothetical protein